jgi:hypothetical protein
VGAALFDEERLGVPVSAAMETLNPAWLVMQLMQLDGLPLYQNHVFSATKSIERCKWLILSKYYILASNTIGI